MSERALVLPARSHRHTSTTSRVVDATARLGSVVTLGALLVLSAVAIGSVGAPPVDTGAHVVTFEIAGH